jgi:hypothetical protein
MFFIEFVALLLGGEDQTFRKEVLACLTPNTEKGGDVII